MVHQSPSNVMDPYPAPVPAITPLPPTPAFRSPEPVQDRVDAAIQNAQIHMKECYVDAENYIRRSPIPSVLTAVAAGYVLNRLPVRAIISAQIRLLATLAPPAVFLFGAAKLYETLKNPPTPQR